MIFNTHNTRCNHSQLTCSDFQHYFSVLISLRQQHCFCICGILKYSNLCPSDIFKMCHDDVYSNSCLLISFGKLNFCTHCKLSDNFFFLCPFYLPLWYLQANYCPTFSRFGRFSSFRAAKLCSLRLSNDPI